MKNKTSFQKLLNIIEQKIVFSLSLSPKQKKGLIQKISSLSLQQLHQLHALLKKEEDFIELLLKTFFFHNPHLFLQFQRLSQERINSLYQSGEKYEQQKDRKKLLKLIQMHY